MILKQISIFLENKEGQLSFPCQLLADNGINITAACLADTSEFGILRLIIENHETATKILQENGYAVNITEVVAVAVSDEPGGLSKILEVVDAQKLNVEYMYAFSTKNKEKALLVFRFSDPDLAARVLQDYEVPTIW